MLCRMSSRFSEYIFHMLRSATCDSRLVSAMQATHLLQPSHSLRWPLRHRSAVLSALVAVCYMTCARLTQAYYTLLQHESNPEAVMEPMMARRGMPHKHKPIIALCLQLKQEAAQTQCTHTTLVPCEARLFLCADTALRPTDTLWQSLL